MAKRRSRKRTKTAKNQKTTVTTAKRTANRLDDDLESMSRARHAKLIQEYRSDFEKVHRMVSYSERAEADALKAMKQVSRYSKRRHD